MTITETKENLSYKKAHFLQLYKLFLKIIKSSERSSISGEKI
jgi:hypothetical protein